jgi:4,5:9,10-diseco-3-hydroxy-5,9,17-trioxoandrosta-1(10),2-diene-4-oate hydrolase
MYSYDETSQTLEAGYRLHYHEAGEGPALILLHGSGPGVTGWTNFGANLPIFAEHFRTIILDMPGFGGSASPEYDQQYPPVAAEAVAMFMEGVGLDSAHLLGNSMGGNVASHVALNYPDRVQRMVMMGPGGLAVNVFGPSPNEGAKRLIEFMGDPSRERMVAWVRTMVSDQALVTDELIDLRMENAMKPGVMDSTRAIFGTFFKFPDPTPLWSRANEIQHPTLITWGRDDRMLPFEGALFPFRQMPNADLHVFSNCGHWAQVERKDDFERVVIDYLLG